MTEAEMSWRPFYSPHVNGLHLLAFTLVVILLVFCYYPKTWPGTAMLESRPPLSYDQDDPNDNNVPNLLLVEPPVYLPGLRNPCWLETVNTTVNPYRNNVYLVHKGNLPLARNLHAHMKYISFKWERKRKRSTQRLRCLPFFYLAGMTKSGTTDISHRLKQHPQILFTLKELSWWARGRHGYKVEARVPMKDYVDLFDALGETILNCQKQNLTTCNQMVIGDASPNNLGDSTMWWQLKENADLKEPMYNNFDYIHHFTPQAKILISLRNPTSRLYSHYKMIQEATGAFVSPTHFHGLVTDSIRSYSNCLKSATLRACVYNQQLQSNKMLYMLTRGIYHVFIQDSLRVFPRDQIFITRLEDYSVDEAQVLKEMHHFLGVDILTDGEYNKIVTNGGIKNKRENTKPMLTATKRLLDQFYQPFNKKLAFILEDRRYLWLPPNLHTRN